jgi:hypothetical protein
VWLDKGGTGRTSRPVRCLPGPGPRVPALKSNCRGAVHRRAHPGQRGKVDHGVKRPVGQSPLADVADVKRQTLRLRILWRDVVEAGDPVACRVEVPDNVGADETGGTSDEDGKRVGIHPRWGGVNRLPKRLDIQAVVS